MKYLQAAGNFLLIVIGLTTIGVVLARFIVDPYVRWLEPIIAEYGPELALLITLLIAIAALVVLLAAANLLGRKRA